MSDVYSDQSAAHGTKTSNMAEIVFEVQVGV